ncbi:hypothetical protein [Actinoplanes sp. NPDC051851]|uniref:hypothetical protein n=1 Tax=Actinoplanes sp. NPDC051851 TaxID=3154753 RepID=UPI00344A54BC
MTVGDSSGDEFCCYPAELLDVSSIPLGDLSSLDQGALDTAIRSVLADVDNATEAISSWSSFVDR